jgi:hypothetical protein
MSTFLMTTSGDLDFSSHGLVKVTDELTETSQKIRSRIRFIQGEWFLDLRVGLPFFSVVFVKRPDLGAVSQMFRQGILSIPSVASVDLTVSLLPTRLLNMNFTAHLKSGGQVVMPDLNSPFIVNTNTQQNQAGAQG